MKIKVIVKGQKDPIIYSGDRIDILDFEMNGEKFKQIRYFKKGIWKVLARTICMPILGELFLLAIIAITRIPVGRFIPVLVIGMYIASIMGVVKENEK